MKKCPECGKTYDDTENYCADCVAPGGGPVKLKTVEKPKPVTPKPKPQPVVTDSGVRSAPSGMRSLGKNAQGYEEFLWLKDSSVMIRVPAGEFWMGASENEGGDYTEYPQHQVYLDEYLIDKLEVTNEQFARFVAATKYVTEAERAGRGEWYDAGSGRWVHQEGVDWRTHYTNSTERHPVGLVTWQDARVYCDWAGKRLPTEAEWEKAARGTDARKYPWGDDTLAWVLLANCADEALSRKYPKWELLMDGYDDGYPASAPVGCFPAGASVYGVMDMAGNVSELCSDWFDANYYELSPDSNPEGPTGGENRVWRGYSWAEPWFTRCAMRGSCGSATSSPSMGFRCAVTPE